MRNTYMGGAQHLVVDGQVQPRWQVTLQNPDRLGPALKRNQEPDTMGLGRGSWLGV